MGGFMDSQYIKNENLAERYLSGDLTVREARAFEKYCREHPQLLEELPIPVRLKARLAREPLEATETGMFPAIPSSTTRAAIELHEDAGDDHGDKDSHLPRGVSRMSVLLGAGLLIAATALAIYAWQTQSQKNQIKTLSTQAKSLQVRAPGSVQTYRLRPGNALPTTPSLQLGWPDPPQLLDLRIDVSDSKFNTFQVTIDKKNEARIVQIRRMARDSNKELRLSLNSSAFGPGEYQIKLEGYNWRGDLSEDGWLTLGLE